MAYVDVPTPAGGILFKFDPERMLIEIRPKGRDVQYMLSHGFLSTGGHVRLAAPPLFVPLASIRPNTPCVNLRKHAIH